MATEPTSPRRAAILRRDGHACVWCGREPWPHDLTLEHLLPRSRGGHSTPENLTPACRTCNRARRSRPVSAYVRELIAAGRAPRLPALETSLRRLRNSARPAESAYAERQLDLLARLAPEPAGMR